MDVSLHLVHYNEQNPLKQTLRAIRRAAPKLSYEVLVVDNNPARRLPTEWSSLFPSMQFLVAPRHLGFGGANNLAAKKGTGRYILVFNPDMFLSYGGMEKLVAYLDAHPDVGIVGPRLQNTDGTLQYSCFRFDHIFAKVLRRTSLGDLPWIRKRLEHHLMKDTSHERTMDVDWLLGGCFCIRRDLWNRLGGFDERFILYFEDTDLCRRAWESGMRVVYHPEVSMVHYHRREGSRGPVWRQIFQRANILHLRSWFFYLYKYGRTPFPR